MDKIPAAERSACSRGRRNERQNAREGRRGNEAAKKGRKGRKGKKGKKGKKRQPKATKGALKCRWRRSPPPCLVPCLHPKPSLVWQPPLPFLFRFVFAVAWFRDWGRP